MDDAGDEVTVLAVLGRIERAHEDTVVADPEPQPRLTADECLDVPGSGALAKLAQREGQPRALLPGPDAPQVTHGAF